MADKLTVALCKSDVSGMYLFGARQRVSFSPAQLLVHVSVRDTSIDAD